MPGNWGPLLQSALLMLPGAVGGPWAVAKFKLASPYAFGEYWSFFQFTALVGRGAHILIPGTF